METTGELITPLCGDGCSGGFSRITRRLAALSAVVAVASCAFAGSAFAATVHGADYQGSGSTLESGEIDVLDVDGAAGETVFLSVEQGRSTLAKSLAYTIGASADARDGSSWAGVATLDITNLDLNALDGSYVIEAYSDHESTNRLYSGALYGVYADLPDETSKLIGTRVADKSELTDRTFIPSETLYVDGETYRQSGDSTNEGGVLHFPYVEYDEATTVDGVVNYIDSTGSVIASTKIAGLKSGETRTVEIPSVITADDGSLYRTVFFQDSVTAENPGATSFNVYCTKMSESDKALSGFYVATIQMVDGDGNVIATDSVDVTGEFVYTAPSVIYKTVEQSDSGEAEVIAYEIAQSPTVRLSAADDGVMNRARTVQVLYEAESLGSSETAVTFNLIDGSKRVGDEGRNLGAQQETVTKDATTAEPKADIEANGTTYHIVGSASDYAYTLGSGETPTVDVYYIPEGYTTSDSYEVTVNYVNFLTDQIIESHSYRTDPDANSRIAIEAPETFSADGVDYVRLAGQEGGIDHNYYSGIESYTVYYRDVNDDLSSQTVVNTLRVVYLDGGTTGTTVTSDAAATAATDAGADGAQAMQLNNGRTYNVMDGADGNSTLTNEGGVDSNTERIDDDATPLASGFDKGASSSAASSFTQMAQWLLPAGIVLAVTAVAVVVLIVIRRRKGGEDSEW